MYCSSSNGIHSWLVYISLVYISLHKEKLKGGNMSITTTLLLALALICGMFGGFYLKKYRDIKKKEVKK